jgi:hypothetical protein
MRKFIGVFIACGALAVLSAACAGPAFKGGEGDSCGGSDDCGANLTCAAVPGRTGSDYCCPTPLRTPAGQNTSNQTNCQPTN